MDTRLDELAQSFGLQTQSWDWKGSPIHVSDDTVVAVLAALGIDASSDAAIDAALADQRDRSWRRPLPSGTVMQQGQVAWVNAHVPTGWPAALGIRLEDGDWADVPQIDNWNDDRLIDGQWLGEATFELPGDLPLGYHRMVLTYGDAEPQQAEASLAVTPASLEMPTDHRLWGYAAQLYSVRSNGSWGIGDFVDLAALATWAATTQHADYVLINPVHAAEPTPPMEPSPYLPSTRRYINPIYIRPDAIPEYAGVAGPDRNRLRKLQTRAVSLPRETIDRDTAWAIKRQALRIVFDAGLSPARQMSLHAWRHSEGRPLHDFGLWTLLCEQSGTDWHAWPASEQRPTSPECDALAADNPQDLAFIEWQQWIAQEQLNEAQHAAREAGMRLGVLTDLAVGTNPDGADTWMMSDVYAGDIEVGAPPDAYNQLGQLWGQPPWRPDRLADLDYAPFRQVVRHALHHAGGLRIDHVMGLFRLWWVPRGRPPNEGCYMRYNHEAMVGILALEAHRAGAVVIGEDLGTVEPWVRDYLARRGILGTSVLWFEYEGGQPLPPDRWRGACIASVTTHDLPPTAGFLALDHVHLRNDLGLLTEPLNVELERAHDEQRWWLDYLANEGYIVNPMDGATLDDVEATVLGLYRALVASPATILCVYLVDAVGDRRTQNQPGTIDEYPNWRVPLCGPDGHPIGLEDVFSSPRPMRLAAVMNGWQHVPPPWSQEVV